MKAFVNAKIFTGEKFLQNKVLLTESGRIVEITDFIPESAEQIDCKSGTLAPGLIDLQIYGGGGYLFSTALTAESLHAIANDLVKKGTTAFNITLATNSFDVFRKAVQIVKKKPHPALLGIHLEGPYMNPLKKGAHIEKYIKKPDIAELTQFLEESGGVVKMMTLAPEQCNKETVELLMKYGVLVSAGHSNATFSGAKESFSWGIKTATHLFNAMSPLHHRKPGLPGAIFQSDEVCASIVADGIHVDFEVIKIAGKLMGSRLFYITDAVEEVKSGDYIHLKKNDHFELPDGTLSGSALTMPLAVRNGVNKVGLTVKESLKMATIYPAKVAGLTDAGKIQKGYKANLVCLDDDLNLRFTVLEGKAISA